MCCMKVVFRPLSVPRASSYPISIFFPLLSPVLSSSSSALTGDSRNILVHNSHVPLCLTQGEKETKENPRMEVMAQSVTAAMSPAS